MRIRSILRRQEGSQRRPQGVSLYGLVGPRGLLDGKIQDNYDDIEDYCR